MKPSKHPNQSTRPDVPEERRQGGASGTTSDPDVASATRYQLLAEAAYCRAECRAFERGCELDDWLAAEVEIDAAFTLDGESATGKRAGAVAS